MLEIRRAVRTDREFILGLVPRLVEFGPPPWRDAAQMTAADTRKLAEVLDAGADDAAVFVAEENGARLGFVELWTVVDYFTDEPHGHISNIAVLAAAEGRGVGRALVAAAEDWCRSRRYRMLSLNVFEENRAARALYERCDFVVDTIRYVKTL